MFVRIYNKAFPGWSRVCTRVLREGTLRTGDAVVITQN
jgi:MOSC domain-containing protein YiiM